MDRDGYGDSRTSLDLHPERHNRGMLKVLAQTRDPNRGWTNTNKFFFSTKVTFSGPAELKICDQPF